MNTISRPNMSICGAMNYSRRVRETRGGPVKRLIHSAVAIVVIAGCSNDSGTAGWDVKEGAGDQQEYGDPGVVVISPGAGTETIIGGRGDGCVELRGDVCVDPGEVREEYCDDPDAQADVIVDRDGKVIDVICYPPRDEGTTIDEVAVSADGSAEVPQSASGAVIIFDDETDGEPIEGDVRLSAERVSLFGNGVDVTILDGNLVVESNNSVARGFTVTGNLTFTENSNNSSVVFCSVHGNLVVPSNGVTIANCAVYGDVDVSGNGAKLINIGVQGAWKINDGTFCDGCYSFADDDDDHVVDAAEIGDALRCAE